MPIYVADMITRYKALMGFDLNDMSSQDRSPSDDQALLVLNQAKDIISKYIYQVDPKITLTLTAGTDTYNLRSSSIVSKTVLRPFEVCIGGNLLWDSTGRKAGMWAFGEFERWVGASWRTASQGTPTIAVYMGNQSMILYPPPTSAVAGGSNFIYGQYLAADMTNVSTSSQEVDLPNEIRYAVCYLAAEITAEPNSTDEQQFARLAKYDSRAVQAINEIRYENRNAFLDTGAMGNEGADFILT